MTVSKDAKITDSVKDLIPLGTYEWPRSETHQTLGHLFAKIKRGFAPEVSEDAVDRDNLRTFSDKALEADIRAALTATLLNSLDQEYGDWARCDTGKRAQRLFVHPPMDDDLLAAWAKRNGFPMVDDVSDISEITDAHCVVVPKLESYFERRHDGLAQVLALFDALTSVKGRVLVGCNSWALRVLNQFDDVRLSLGQGDTIPAFDAHALAAIFEAGIDQPAAFLSVASGDPVFKRDDDGDLCDPFLCDLADRSLGHPWVAVEMFLQGMTEAKDDGENSEDQHSWVQLPAACSLPDAGKDTLLFALHSLLIHGTRKAKAFEALLPNRIPNGAWSELNRSGFVDLDDGYVSCAIRNYPDTRSELSAAGFNLDRL